MDPGETGGLRCSRCGGVVQGTRHTRTGYTVGHYVLHTGRTGEATVRRRDEIPAAERIVEEETDLFWAWYGGLGVVPIIKELRQRMDDLRAVELERALRQLGHLSAEDRARVEQFSQALLNKFLHQPTIALKAAADEGRGYGLLEALRRLFGMEPGGSE